MDDVPHIGIPIQVLGGRFATVQQDTNDEVAACVSVIVSFPVGSREEAPEFGVPDPAFQTRPLDIAAVEEAVEEYEPRAAIEVSETPYDPHDPLSSGIRIEVSVPTSEEA